jgi:hypothetical protein
LLCERIFVTRYEYPFDTKLALPAQLILVVATATIHRPTFTRFERYLGLLATLSTYHGEHLALRSSAEATVSIARSFFRLAAFKAAFGFVGKTLGSEEFLLTCGEGESFAAISTHDRFVYETHGTASFLKLLGQSWGHPRLDKLGADY